MVSRMFRQGDVLLVPTVPATESEMVEQGEAVVLVLGEATGHAHVARGVGLNLARARGEVFLTVPAPGGELTHDEHATIPLPPGTYRIVRQREYVPRAPGRERPIGELPVWDYVED